jgi:hypothetical protein
MKLGNIMPAVKRSGFSNQSSGRPQITVSLDPIVVRVTDVDGLK